VHSITVLAIHGKIIEVSLQRGIATASPGPVSGAVVEQTGSLLVTVESIIDEAKGKGEKSRQSEAAESWRRAGGNPRSRPRDIA